MNQLLVVLSFLAYFSVQSLVSPSFSTDSSFLLSKAWFLMISQIGPCNFLNKSKKRFVLVHLPRCSSHLPILAHNFLPPYKWKPGLMLYKASRPSQLQIFGGTACWYASSWLFFGFRDSGEFPPIKQSALKAKYWSGTKQSILMPSIK